jgi:hypothetical protein
MTIAVTTALMVAKLCLRAGCCHFCAVTLVLMASCLLSCCVQACTTTAHGCRPCTPAPAPTFSLSHPCALLLLLSYFHSHALTPLLLNTPGEMEMCDLAHLSVLAVLVKRSDVILYLAMLFMVFYVQGCSYMWYKVY